VRRCRNPASNLRKLHGLNDARATHCHRRRRRRRPCGGASAGTTGRGNCRVRAVARAQRDRRWPQTSCVRIRRRCASPNTTVVEAVPSPNPFARLAQNEESGSLGGEAGSGGGLGALTDPAGTFSAASDKTSALRSPAFASSMILPAMISSLRSRGHLMAARATSNATPRRRTVSGSKVWPVKNGLMGTRSSPQSRTESKLVNFPL
jgi:hypothetical protein